MGANSSSVKSIPRKSRRLRNPMFETLEEAKRRDRNARSLARPPNPSDVPSSMRVVHASVDRDWILRQTLGTGFSGAVVLATHRTTGLQAAVKTFSKKHQGARIQMLRNEIEVYLRLDHPNICRLLWTYETADKVWFVMELCTLELYDKLCDRKVFAEDETANIVSQMLFAVNYLHCHQIVHRDLKLENWMYACAQASGADDSAAGVGPLPTSDIARCLSFSSAAPSSGRGPRGPRRDDDRIKLIDFGFSKVFLPEELLDLPCGTLHYASPDVLKRNYNAKCDIWSLGVICYMLLVGSPPFAGTRNAAVLEKIRNGKVRHGLRWQALSLAAKDFVTKCLTVPPEERLSAQEALEHEFLAPFVKPATPSPSLTAEVFHNLRSFAAFSTLQRAAFQLLAYSLTSEEMFDLQDVFLSYDSNGRGTIEFDDLLDVLEARGFITAGEDFEHIFEAISCGGQEIHYTSFLAAMVPSKIQLRKTRVQQVFNLFDPSQDGFVSVEDLVHVFAPVGLTPQEAGQWIQAHDIKGNGLLDYEAFLCALNYSTHTEALPEVTFVAPASSDSLSMDAIAIEDGYFSPKEALCPS